MSIKTQSKWPALLWTLPSNSGVYQNPVKMAILTVDAALEARGWRVKHCTTLSDWLIMVRNLNVFLDCKSSTELILEDEMDTAGQATGNTCSPMLFILSSTFLCPPPPPQQIKTICYQCYPFITTDYLNVTHYDFPTL